MSNLWTTSETNGAPSELVIEYKSTNAQNQVEQKSQALTSTTTGSSKSEYTELGYLDRDGKPQTSEVLTRKVDKTRNTIAAVNPGYVAWRLTKKLGLPSGDALSENITTSEYITTVDGPVLATETSEQYISMAQFSGGLQLEEWGSFRPSGSEMVLSHRTIRRMDYLKTAESRDVTRTRTERYIAAAESSEWKNYAAKRGKDIKALVSKFPEAIEPFVRSMTPLVYEGTEVQIETGRIPVPSKPPDEDIAAQQVTDGAGEIPSDATPTDVYGNDLGWPAYVPGGSSGDWQKYNKDSDGDGVPDWAPYVPGDWRDFDTSDIDFTTTNTTVSNDKFITGVVLFSGQAFNPDDTTVTATYDMPFAPDDYFEYVNNVPKLKRGGALAAAEAFGLMESALDVGHAYGQNIVTGWNEAPTLDLSPVYVQLAGIEGAFLLDSCSYAWGPEGMVISSDLMLLGVSGWYGAAQPATSWLRLPVPVAGLQQVGAGTAGTASKANSIAIPAGFSARNPGPVLAQLPNNGADTFALSRTGQNLVGPTLELEQTRLATGPLLIAREFAYALELEPEVASIATGPFITESTVVAPPAAVISVTSLAPVVVSGASVAVPAAAITIAALPPAVAGGASVAVPAAGITVGALAPDLVGRPRTQILVPAAELTLAGLAPSVVSGASVAVPAAGVTVAAVAPVIQGSINVAGITYSQSSTWSGATAASNSIMTDGLFNNTGTATNIGNPAWVRMDLGRSYQVGKVIVGTATSNIPGGWSKTYTENRSIQYSTDGTTWTTAFSTGTFASNGIYTFTTSFTARYIRIATTTNDYAAISEFYALSPGQSYP